MHSLDDALGHGKLVFAMSWLMAVAFSLSLVPCIDNAGLWIAKKHSKLLIL